MSFVLLLLSASYRIWLFSCHFSKFISCYVTIPNGNRISVKQGWNKIYNLKINENLVLYAWSLPNSAFFQVLYNLPTSDSDFMLLNSLLDLSVCCHPCPSVEKP